MIELTVTAPQTVAIKGELDTLAAAEADKQFQRLTATQTEATASEPTATIDLSRPVVLDLAELSYISSSGLRFLLSLHKSATKAGGTLRVVNLTDMVAHILTLTGFDALLR